MTKRISQLNELRIQHYIFHQVRGYEDYPALLGQHHITWQNRRPANSDGHIDTTQHHLLYIGRIISFHPAVEPIYFFQPFDVPYSAIKDHPPVRMGVNSVTQVISDQRSIH